MFLKSTIGQLRGRQIYYVGKFTMVSKPIDLGLLVVYLGSIDLLCLLKLHHCFHISTSRVCHGLSKCWNSVCLLCFSKFNA
jgi:hypothetical protein